MNIKIQAVKFTMDDKQKDYLDQKMKRIEYADDLITDLLCHIKLDKKFIYETTVNFRWGSTAHVSTENYEFEAGVNKMMDIIDQKVRKEKDKIQEKK